MTTLYTVPLVVETTMFHQAQQSTPAVSTLKLKIDKLTRHVALLEKELSVTIEALQEKSDFADALEQDYEHIITIYNCHVHSGKTSSGHAMQHYV